MNIDPRTKSLIKLLNDEDSNISGQAMAELLALESDSKPDLLSELLSELQETHKPELRKKIHQMQSIQRIRRRRRNFSKRLKSHSPNLLQGLGELHAIWYDDLETKELSKMWSEIIREAAKCRPVTPKRLAGSMKLSGFAKCDENIQDADLYCLGAIIEDRIGSDVILAAITLEIGRSFGLKGSIVRLNGFFGTMYVATVQDEKEPKTQLRGAIIMPSENWEIVPVPDDHKVEIWTTDQVLKYVAAMLFVNAVCSEGPRYIQILGACLADTTVNNSLSEFLPPPFGKRKSDKLKSGLDIL